MTHAGTPGGRDFFDCATCGLLFLDPTRHPTPAEERARYEEHRNDPRDPGYRRFLERLLTPLVRRLEPGAVGLDFGCGPGPALVPMLRARGFAAEGYDPIFAPDGALLAQQWDFVACTEVIEHFHRPAEGFGQLAGLLRPGGLLAVMTDPLTPEVDLASWYYLRDPTHVSLYRAETFRWIAESRGWSLERPDPRVAIFRTLRLSARGATPGAPAARSTPSARSSRRGRGGGG